MPFIMWLNAIYLCIAKFQLPQIPWPPIMNHMKKVRRFNAVVLWWHSAVSRFGLWHPSRRSKREMNRRRTYIILTILILLCFFAAAAAFFYLKEPRYQGRSIAQWLEDATPSDPVTDKFPYQEAILAMPREKSISVMVSTEASAW